MAIQLRNPISYKYNANGIRTEKTVNGVTTKYFIEDDRIVLEKVGNEERAFWYDGDGKAAAFVIYDSTGMHPYYYIRNGQRDVIGLFDANGTIVARYTYDSWGNLLSIKDGSGNDKTNDTAFVGYKNPLRYRGYYYDSETKLYYLQSRYYNPEWNRFINADGIGVITTSPMGLTDQNLFSYCDNNPIMRMDASGALWDTIFDIVSLAMSAADVVMNPGSASAWASLGADVVCTAVPFVSGGGTIVKAISKVDDVVDTVKSVKTIKSVTTARTAKKLHRPYIRKPVRRAVEAAALRAPDGRFLDANTHLPINGKYDLGHKPGHEFWRERSMAMDQGWSQKQFNDYMNDPAFYQIENPVTNRNHMFELR